MFLMSYPGIQIIAHSDIQSFSYHEGFIRTENEKDFIVHSAPVLAASREVRKLTS